jgi:hypothetical protein
MEKLDTNVRGQGSFPCLWLWSILLGTDSFRVILWRQHIALLLRFLMFFSLAAWRSPITVQSTPLSCTVPSNFLTNVLTNQLSLFLAQIQVLPRQLDMIEWFNILIMHLTVSNSSMGLMKWKWNEWKQWKVWNRAGEWEGWGLAYRRVKEQSQWESGSYWQHDGHPFCIRPIRGSLRNRESGERKQR